MAFTVSDFRDLVSLLEAHPEWRDELRRLVLTEEVLGLPAAIRALAEAQRRTEARVEELAEAQRRTEVAVRDLADTQRVMRNDQRVMRSDLDALRGQALETKYRDHASGFFGRLLRRVRVLRPDELDTLLDEAIEAGALDDEAALDLRLADLLVRGRRPGEDTETYLVVEVSAGIGAGDVERAARRADVLRRIRPTLAVVAGDWLTPEARELAASAGVWKVLEGRTLHPDDQRSA